MGDAEVEGEVESLADGGVCVDDDARVDALGGDHDVVIVGFVEDAQVFFDFFDLLLIACERRVSAVTIIIRHDPGDFGESATNL